MILFISSRESDYLQDLTYAGLAELLGKDRVVDFPSHWQYHRSRKYVFSPPAIYPRNLGYIPDVQRKVDSSLGFVRRLLAGNEFRLVILASVKPDALESIKSVMDLISVPWAFIDGGDWPEVGGDFKRIGGQDALQKFQTLCAQRPPALIFKRELPVGKNIPTVFPLPFSACAAQIPIMDPASGKKNQVAFWAVESSATRRKVFEILKRRYDCDQNGSISGQNFKKYSRRGGSYFNSLNQTRISLSFQGEGFDTLRFWEIPLCGSLLLSEEPTIQIPHPFTHGVNAVFCKNDLSDLISLIDHYLTHEREALQITREGQTHLLKYHTQKSRAEYVLEIINSKLGVRFV